MQGVCGNLEDRPEIWIKGTDIFDLNSTVIAEKIRPKGLHNRKDMFVCCKKFYLELSLYQNLLDAKGSRANVKMMNDSLMKLDLFMFCNTICCAAATYSQ